MREVTITTTKLGEAYKQSSDVFDALVENIQNELSNNDTLLIVLEVYKEHGKEVKRKVTQFIRPEDFNKWVDSQYPIL